MKHVERARGRVTQVLDDVGVDHRRLDVDVPEVLLDLPDVHAVQQQVRREAVAQRVDRDRLVDAGLDRRCLTAFCTTESLM